MRIGDVVTLDAVVSSLYKDGTVLEYQLTDEEGRTLALFASPEGYSHRPDAVVTRPRPVD